MTRRLLTYTTDHRVSVRRTIFELLSQLCSPVQVWPLVADAAEAALGDADSLVRRTAATLLTDTAEPDRAMAALDVSNDPVLRIGLVDAMPWHKVPRHRAILERLRSDPVPAIRLRASVAVFSEDESAAWPALDAAILADLEACAGVLDAPGSRTGQTAGQYWAQALTGLDRESDCYTWAERLTDPGQSPPVRLEGVRMAVAAMRQWRAAPGRLTPMPASLLRDEPFAVRSAALRAVAASLTASRLAAEDLVAALDDPELGAVAATALGSAGDRRAMPHLVRLMLAESDEQRLAEAFRALARAGVDPEASVAAARQILAAYPASEAPDLPMHVLAEFGLASAAAVPELIARLAGAENDTPDMAFRVLGRIGPAAAAAVPLLRQYSTQGTRRAHRPPAPAVAEPGQILGIWRGGGGRCIVAPRGSRRGR